MEIWIWLAINNALLKVIYSLFLLFLFFNMNNDGFMVFAMLSWIIEEPIKTGTWVSAVGYDVVNVIESRGRNCTQLSSREIGKLKNKTKNPIKGFSNNLLYHIAISFWHITKKIYYLSTLHFLFLKLSKHIT